MKIKPASCIPLHAAPSYWVCAASVAGGMYALWFNTGNGPYVYYASDRHWT